MAPLVDRVCRSHHWLKKPGEHPSHVNAALTDERIELHLDGGFAVGACPMAPGSSTTRCAVLDLDSHKGEFEWHSMKRVAGAIIAALAECELRAIPFRSSGGMGIHLVMLWKDEQDAYSVREALKIALVKCGLTSGTGGLFKGEVEIFPKQDRVPADGFGSMFVLPLNGKSCALLDDTLDDTVPSLIKWKASSDVAIREKPDAPTHTVATTAQHAIVKSALDAIPNSGAQELSYDQWRNVVFAIHSATDGDDGGLALAHDFSRRAGKYDAQFLDERVWPYVRTERENGITVRTLYNLAAAHGWNDPSIIDDFEVLAPGSTADQAGFAPLGEPQSAGATRFKALTIPEFVASSSPQWIIKDVLPQAALAVIFGESTSGKTFFAIDMVGAVARGVEWRGKKVMQRNVVYICAEGVAGFRNRVRSYVSHHAVDGADLPLRVIPDAPNFMKTDDIVDVLASLRACGDVGVIVVDTFAQVMPGANENSGEDVGKAIYHCQQLHRQTGALVVLIHHAGKDASKGARGWSGLRAAADAEIEITRFESDRMATITKLKDGEDGTELGFRLKPWTTDTADDDGEVVMSCVVEHVAGAVKVRKGKREPKGDIERIVARVFEDLELADAIVPYHELKTETVNRIPHDTDKEDRRGERVRRAIDSLIARNYIERHEHGVRRVE